MRKVMRKDIHRPSAIRPEDYEFVAVHYIGPDSGDLGMVLANREAMNWIRKHKERTGGRMATHEHGGTCYICGATAFYLAVYHHPASNEYIQCGEDCAIKMDMGDTEAFTPMRRAIRDARLAKAGKMKAERVLADADLSDAWTVYVNREKFFSNDDAAHDAAGHELAKLDALEPNGHIRRDAATIADIVAKLVKYGSISEKQEGFVRSLLERLSNRAEIERRRSEEAADCPTGRVTVTGTVVKLEDREGFGYDSVRTVMTVKDDSGFLVWGTCPSILVDESIERGERVEFTATVTPSDRDPKFGFFKRPAKARKLEGEGTDASAA